MNRVDRGSEIRTAMIVVIFADESAASARLVIQATSEQPIGITMGSQQYGLNASFRGQPRARRSRPLTKS